MKIYLVCEYLEIDEAIYKKILIAYKNKDTANSLVKYLNEKDITNTTYGIEEVILMGENYDD